MLLDFELAVVTGGSSGIGKAFIATMREANPDLRICNISRTDPGVHGVVHFSCDLAEREARQSVLPEVEKWVAGNTGGGRLLLINNSGFGTYGRFPEPKTTRHLEMIELNVAAPVDLTARLLPELRRRGGAVINVASTAAFQPVPILQTYAATKAFLLSWSVALGEELPRDRVRVLALCPGPTHTNFRYAAGMTGKVVEDSLSQEPDEVVAAAFRALAGGRRVVVSGFRNRLVAWIASHVPRAWSAHVAKQVLMRYRHARDS